MNRRLQIHPARFRAALCSHGGPWLLLTLSGFLLGVSQQLLVRTEEPKAAGDLFHEHCAGCHGLDGKAHTPMARKLGVKDLTQSKISDEEIEKQIREGKIGSDGKVTMPAFKKVLADREISDLVTFVKGLRKEH